MRIDGLHTKRMMGLFTLGFRTIEHALEAYDWFYEDKALNYTFLELLDNDQKALNLLLANIEHESRGFQTSAESGNYTPKRARQVFKKYFKNQKEAKAIIDQGEEAFFNHVYGGRMGNADDEGYMFRGRGWPQLTGRNNYEHVSEETSIDFVSDPDLLLQPKYSAIATKSYLTDHEDLIEALLAHDVEKACKVYNGGTNGLEDRQRQFDEINLATEDSDFHDNKICAYGNKGLLVTALQYYIAQMSCDFDFTIDGHWGKKTQKALESLGIDKKVFTYEELTQTVDFLI